jgi:hypothetical protein
VAYYKIVVDGLAAFVVEVTSAGGFHSVRGFPTEAAARQWIAEQVAAELGRGLENEGTSDLP